MLCDVRPGIWHVLCDVRPVTGQSLGLSQVQIGAGIGFANAPPSILLKVLPASAIGGFLVASNFTTTAGQAVVVQRTRRVACRAEVG